MRNLFSRRLRGEEPHPSALLLGVLREDELRAALELERERRRLRRLVPGLQELQAARGHEVDHEDQLAVVGREEKPLTAPLRSAEAPALELFEWRVERLQRRDVRRPRLRDREGGDGIIELAPPRLH